MPEVALDTGDTMLLLDLVAAGFGVTLLPRSTLAHTEACVTAVRLSPVVTSGLALARRRKDGRAAFFAELLRGATDADDGGERRDGA
ncbi:LysR substrate-binding domain-containing protein [Roseomonas sp. CCTCC AB2023176]|uniref:LysR substrate-binding domain-containing protein n=1 Tax=Roseomonas sp. CCTCC AB2023176 TaxID=3342640 RepID=UPI0035D76E2D